MIRGARGDVRAFEAVAVAYAEDCSDAVTAQELCRAHGIGDELHDRRRICLAEACSMGGILASALERTSNARA